MCKIACILGVVVAAFCSHANALTPGDPKSRWGEVSEAISQQVTAVRKSAERGASGDLFLLRGFKPFGEGLCYAKVLRVASNSNALREPHTIQDVELVTHFAPANSRKSVDGSCDQVELFGASFTSDLPVPELLRAWKIVREGSQRWANVACKPSDTAECKALQVRLERGIVGDIQAIRSGQKCPSESGDQCFTVLTGPSAPRAILNVRYTPKGSVTVDAEVLETIVN